MNTYEDLEFDGIVSAEDLIEASTRALWFFSAEDPTEAQQLWGLYCSDCIHLEAQIEKQYDTIAKLETALELTKWNIDLSQHRLTTQKEEILKHIEKAKTTFFQSSAIYQKVFRIISFLF